MKLYPTTLLYLLLLLVSCGLEQTKTVENEKVHKKEQKDQLADTVFYNNRKVKQITQVVLGKKNGLYILFSEKGDTLLFGNYKNDRKDGRWLAFGGDTIRFYKNAEYFEALPPANRQLAELHYINDTLVKKIERTWFLNSKQLETETITHYSKDTIVKETGWYENGKLSNVNSSINGLSNDTSKAWRENGVLVYEGLDKMGKLIYLKEFDKKGKIISIKKLDKNGKLKEERVK